MKIKTSGAITDFVIQKEEILISTDAGTIETVNLKKGTQRVVHKLPPMKDFMGDDMPTKIYSIDKISDKIIMITQGNHGFRNLTLIDNNSSIKILDAERDKLMIKKVRFIDEKSVLIATLGNELILFSLETLEKLYSLAISSYSFSDFSLTEDKRFVFTSDESGVVHMIDIKAGKIVNEYSGLNVDNVYRVDYKNNVIITAGQDRRVGVYNTALSDQYYLQKDFLVYSAALNTDATTGAFCASEENDITLFDVTGRSEHKILKGHNSVVTKMEFFDNRTLISAADDGYLMVWKIEE